MRGLGEQKNMKQEAASGKKSFPLTPVSRFSLHVSRFTISRFLNPSIPQLFVIPGEGLRGISKPKRWTKRTLAV